MMTKGIMQMLGIKKDDLDKAAGFLTEAVDDVKKLKADIAAIKAHLGIIDEVEVDDGSRK